MRKNKSRGLRPLDSLHGAMCTPLRSHPMSRPRSTRPVAPLMKKAGFGHVQNSLKGGSGLSFWKKVFRARGWWGRPGHVPTFCVVLGPYVQYCPCEASEQKLGQKPKSKLKKIELSYCHHSICLKKKWFRKNNVKFGWKMTKLWPNNVHAPKCKDW